MKFKIEITNKNKNKKRRIVVESLLQVINRLQKGDKFGEIFDDKASVIGYFILE